MEQERMSQGCQIRSQDSTSFLLQFGTLKKKFSENWQGCVWGGAYPLLHYGRTTCGFPPAWWGNWFQQGFSTPILVNSSHISSQGECVESLGEKFIVRDTHVYITSWCYAWYLSLPLPEDCVAVPPGLLPFPPPWRNSDRDHQAPTQAGAHREGN
ncbi:unnamed protein product [Cyprideis torosa]|uniref:DUF7044 domain-containing protein n=1 Tax=Cyprideis torosa TaxID=163714 RepID=A0A7R8ZJ36_9CRUS|nr:unnamed protein product [Cyprideis torosa]CAG0886020.1 unnamed protein product [Cyprideis torosa]